MKKFAALLLALSMIFCFAACKNDKTDADATPSVEAVTQKTDARKYEEIKAAAGVEDNYRYNELKSEDGEVRFIVKVTLPKLTEATCDPAIADAVNYYFESKYYDAAKTLGEANIENAKNHMVTNESTMPWSVQISYEVRYFDGNYLSVVLKYSMSYGGNVEPVLRAECINLNDGSVCTSDDFLINSVDEATKGIVLDTIKDAALTQLNPEKNLTEEELAKVEQAFDPATKFYITERGIVFFFEKSSVVPALRGTYEHEFLWNEIDYIYQIPSAE